ncbi:MAG: HU family DNA-binding protein [Bacteroidales bacterium]|nr:HU family DNA-binding protein [Bacteroidales bacterium]MCM1146611.1 HU family DNA-binding protein [Bacteroidales bacterium]MCM1206003.1 HU family DNA-binding protein [Bacillota bacterium]MCM1510115.1 HU family DNA-binding protein [Clostridium sp.]
MSVLYKIKKIERKYSDGRVDPANNKWYASAVIINTVSTDKIAERIEEKCTLTKADVKGCIEALIHEIKDQLQNSYAVKLDGLGTFKLSLHSKGAESLEEFSVQKNIVGTKVLFLPTKQKDTASGKVIANLTYGVKCVKAPESKTAENSASAA